MYQGTLSNYRDQINALLERLRWAPELSNDALVADVNRLLDWVDDKGGQEFSLSEIAEVLDGDIVRAWRAMAPLCGGEPLADTFVKVRLPDGSLVLRDELQKVEGLDGALIVPVTGVVAAMNSKELDEKSFIFFRFTNFEPVQKLSL